MYIYHETSAGAQDSDFTQVYKRALKRVKLRHLPAANHLIRVTFLDVSVYSPDPNTSPAFDLVPLEQAQKFLVASFLDPQNPENQVT